MVLKVRHFKEKKTELLLILSTSVPNLPVYRIRLRLRPSVRSISHHENKNGSFPLPLSSLVKNCSPPSSEICNWGSVAFWELWERLGKRNDQKYNLKKNFFYCDWNFLCTFHSNRLSWFSIFLRCGHWTYSQLTNKRIFLAID